MKENNSDVGLTLTITCSWSRIWLIYLLFALELWNMKVAIKILALTPSFSNGSSHELIIKANLVWSLPPTNCHTKEFSYFTVALRVSCTSVERAATICIDRMMSLPHQHERARAALFCHMRFRSISNSFKTSYFHNHLSVRGTQRLYFHLL